MDAFDLVVYMIASRAAIRADGGSAQLPQRVRWQYVKDLPAIDREVERRLEAAISMLLSLTCSAAGTTFRSGRRHVFDGLAGVLLAWAGSDLVGFCGYGLWKEGRVRIVCLEIMGVLPEYEGRGLERLLIIFTALRIRVSNLTHPVYFRVRAESPIILDAFKKYFRKATWCVASEGDLIRNVPLGSRSCFSKSPPSSRMFSHDKADLLSGAASEQDSVLSLSFRLRLLPLGLALTGELFLRTRAQFERVKGLNPSQ